MRRKWMPFIALAALLPALPAAAGRGAQSEPFFFVQLSDPQFGMFRADSSFEQESASFELAIATVNRLKPAFVVVTGDLVNRRGDRAQVAAYRRIAAKLDPGIALYNVAGNHDVGNVPTPTSIEAYRRDFGPDHYTFRYRDLEGIVLNSPLIQAPDSAPALYEEQERWLAEQLARPRPVGVRYRVVFQHHSWFLHDPDEPDQYFNIPRERRLPHLALFLKSGVTYVFSGHYHRNAVGRDGPIEMVTTGPVGKPLGSDPSGIRVVIVRPTGIEHRYYGLGNLPTRIEPGR